MRSPAHEPISLGAKVKAGSWGRRGARSARLQVPLELRSCPAPSVMCCKALGAGSDFFSTVHAAFWRGAAAIALAVFVALLVVAFTVPEVYESERGHLVRARPLGLRKTMPRWQSAFTPPSSILARSSGWRGV